MRYGMDLPGLNESQVNKIEAYMVWRWKAEIEVTELIKMHFNLHHQLF
jgi:hypothetical protein